jgi:biotin transport system substrate-specific component
MKLGIAKAWSVGIVPFILASLIKNALGAILVPALRYVVDRRG